MYIHITRKSILHIECVDYMLPISKLHIVHIKIKYCANDTHITWSLHDCYIRHTRHATHSTIPVIISLLWPSIYAYTSTPESYSRCFQPTWLHVYTLPIVNWTIHAHYRVHTMVHCTGKWWDLYAYIWTLSNPDTLGTDEGSLLVMCPESKGCNLTSGILGTTKYVSVCSHFKLYVYWLRCFTLHL